MNALRLVALLTYTFGAFAYGAILWLWVTQAGGRGWARNDRNRGDNTRELSIVNGVLLVLTFGWFCGNVGLVLYRFVPLPEPPALEVAALCMAFLFPPVIMHLTLAEVSAAHRVSGAWRIALWPAYAAALLIPAWSLWVLSSPSVAAGPSHLAERMIGFGLSAMFLAAAFYCITLIARHKETRDRRALQSRRWMLRLFGLMSVVFVLLVLVTGQPGGLWIPLGAMVELAAKSLPLVFMFVGTYNDNRYQFFDLFVKGGASVVVTLVTLAASFAVLLPLLQMFATGWASPWVFAVILLPVAIAIPWLNRHVGNMLDRRWLGRRYTAVEAVKHFIGQLRSATTEEQLRAQARHGLEDIFSATADVIVGEAPAHEPAVREIPVRSGNRIVGRFVMGPRAGDAPYFSQDIALLASLADVFAHVLENLHLQERRLEQEHRAQELSLSASRSELKALRAQINPHFLFNALNSIAGLIHRDPAVADRTIEQLADVFRYALRGAESEWAILDDEMDFVRAYLDVERARFGDRLRTAVRIEDGARGARVPTMVVQTLVENAVKHGVAAVRGQASVTVDAREQSGRLVMSVTDNGPGFREAEQAPLDTAEGRPRGRGGYGLVNIRQRLEGYFGPDAGLSVARKDGLTVVSVELPLLRQEPRTPHVREVAR